MFIDLQTSSQLADYCKGEGSCKKDVKAKIKVNMITAQLEDQRIVITTISPYSAKLVELIAKD